MHLHHYIQTSWCLCDSAWSRHHTYIYNICTNTIYRSTWTGSSFTALCTWYETTTQRRGEWRQWLVGECFKRDYSTIQTANLVTEKQPNTGFWREFKGIIHQISGFNSFGFTHWGLKNPQRLTSSESQLCELWSCYMLTSCRYILTVLRG